MFGTSVCTFTRAEGEKEKLAVLSAFVVFIIDIYSLHKSGARVERGGAKKRNEK